MKKLLIKILPYLVAFVTGIVMYILTQKFITDTGLNNLFVNIASGLVSIPTVFIFYDVINKITSRNLHNLVFESVTLEVNTQLIELIDCLCHMLHMEKPSSIEELDDFLELDEDEIYRQIVLQKDHIVLLEDIKKNLTLILHKPSFFDIVTEQQMSSLLNIVKEITFLIKDMTQFFETSNKIKYKKIISQTIEKIIDNLTIWIESGQKDAFHHHARFKIMEIK